MRSYEQIPITSTHLSVVFAVVLTFVLIMSAIYCYHWYRYRFGSPAVYLAGIVYAAGAAFLALSAYGALTLY